LALFAIVCNPFCNDEEDPIHLAEKVYLHIDRVYYNSDDNIWFKAYVIDASTNKFSINTNNLHVELISPDSRIYQSRTVRIEGGIGNGDFHLNDSISSGNYIIRAYTNHMRNFDDRLIFQREIFIINPGDEAQELNRDIQYVENDIDINFFPEGGSLIDNVSSTVAFKAVNLSGKGCDVTGELFSSSGDLITTFKSIHHGMGYFTLKPVPGISYTAIVKNSDGAIIETGLPESLPTGVTISAIATHDKKLFVTINTNEESLPSLNGRDLDLSCSLPNLITRVTKIKITSLINNFLLPVDDFPDGIIRVTLSEAEGLPLCERLVYLQKNNDVYLEVATDKKDYNPREKVSVSVSLTDDLSLSYSGVLSFSAAETGLTDNSSPFPTSIASWFLLESDVHGPVEEPSYYFDPSNKNRLEYLDLLLLTQGWRDFKWKRDFTFSFRHEIGFTLTGRVKRIIGSKPIEGVKINMGIFQNESTQYLTSETDSMGFFSFEGMDITSKAKMFLSATGKNERTEGRIFIDSLSYEPPEIGKTIANTPKLELLPGNYSVLKQEAVFKLASKKRYKLSDTINVGEVMITASRTETPQELQVKESRKFYGSTDKELIVPPEMDNFAGDVFDLISGRIPGVQVIKSIDGIQVYIRNQKRNGGALILLDGMVVGMDYISTVPVFMIDRIDVLNSSPAFGASGANGVVNIITRTGMRRNPGISPPNTAIVEFSGFDAPRIFYSPAYNTPKRPADPPDTRSTIFWEPNISIDKNITTTLEFFNADNPTTINITVEGITTEGIPVTGKSEYNVR